MNHGKFVYPNGLRLLTIPMQSTETVTVLVLVGTGSRYETREINGISHFLEHLMFKGTTKRPGALDISEELDAIGAEYNAFTSKEYTGYYVKCAAAKLDIALDVISDIFQNSKFDAGEIDRERGPVKEEINMYFDTPARYVGTLYELLMYGDQPLGWDIAGPKENIDKLQRDQFVEYFNTHYFAQNTVIAVAGNIESEAAKTKIQKYFNNIREHEHIKPATAPMEQDSPRLTVFHKTTEQTHIELGFRAWSRFDPRYETLEVIATILGGGMSSRMFVEVRERRGLAYRVSTGVDVYHETGDLTTSAGLTNSKLHEALNVILEQYHRLVRDPVPAKELLKAKDYLKGKFLIGLEPSDAQAGFYGEQELLENRILTPEERLAKIDEVTSEHIQKVATELFRPDRLNFALVGPQKGEDELKKILHDFGN
ncbi:MAG: pitrilysin family protein [Patescibacteria group bacterium]